MLMIRKLYFQYQDRITHGISDFFCIININVAHTYQMYPVSPKEQDALLLPLTSPNVNRFSKFFHQRTQQQICNKEGK